jgi:ABC-type Fe3+-siderophore transport system permease subunit
MKHVIRIIGTTATMFLICIAINFRGMSLAERVLGFIADKFDPVYYFIGISPDGEYYLGTWRSVLVLAVAIGIIVTLLYVLARTITTLHSSQRRSALDKSLFYENIGDYKGQGLRHK